MLCLYNEGIWLILLRSKISPTTNIGIASSLWVNHFVAREVLGSWPGLAGLPVSAFCSAAPTGQKEEFTNVESLFDIIRLFPPYYQLTSTLSFLSSSSGSPSEKLPVVLGAQEPDTIRSRLNGIKYREDFKFSELGVFPEFDT